MHVLARTVTLYFYACAAATAHPPYAGGQGRATLSHHPNVSCGTVDSFTHFRMSLFVGSVQIDKMKGRREGGVKNKLLSHIKNVQNANRLKIHTEESVYVCVSVSVCVCFLMGISIVVAVLDWQLS